MIRLYELSNSNDEKNLGWFKFRCWDLWYCIVLCVTNDISEKKPTVLYTQSHIIKRSSLFTITFYEIQIKFPLSHIMKTYRGVEVQLHSFLTSAPDEDESLNSRPGHMISEKERQYPLNVRLGAPPEAVWKFWRREKPLMPTEIRKDHPASSTVAIITALFQLSVIFMSCLFPLKTEPVKTRQCSIPFDCRHKSQPMCSHHIQVWNNLFCVFVVPIYTRWKQITMISRNDRGAHWIHLLVVFLPALYTSKQNYIRSGKSNWSKCSVFECLVCVILCRLQHIEAIHDH